MKYKFIFDEYSFQCAKSLDGLSNVVEVINWRYGNDEATISGCSGFPAPSEASFTPFDKLTYEQVVGWLVEANDMEQLDAAVDNEIVQKNKASNQEVLPPPFAN
jgi:hypothetical protein